MAVSSVHHIVLVTCFFGNIHDFCMLSLSEILCSHATHICACRSGGFSQQCYSNTALHPCIHDTVTPLHQRANSQQRIGARLELLHEDNSSRLLGNHQAIRRHPWKRVCSHWRQRAPLRCRAKGGQNCQSCVTLINHMTTLLITRIRIAIPPSLTCTIILAGTLPEPSRLSNTLCMRKAVRKQREKKPQPARLSLLTSQHPQIL